MDCIEKFRVVYCKFWNLGCKHAYKNIPVGKSRDRSSHRRCSVRKGVLRNFTKFTGKHLCQSLFLNGVARPATILKKGLWHRCFPVNFVKLLRTPFLQSTSGGCFCIFDDSIDRMINNQ